MRLSLALCAVLCGCGTDVHYSVPRQRTVWHAAPPGSVEHFVTMNHPKIDQYIVRDISYALEGGSWRWTGKRPALRLHAPPDQELNFITDFAVPEITMKETGPVSITFFLEGRPLDRVRCDAPGQRRFQKRVPPEWQLGGIITAEAEIDKVWVSPEDGRELGFVLVRAGFVR